MEAAAFVVLFLCANLYFAYRFQILYRLAAALKGSPWNGDRTDRPLERLKTFFVYVLGQKAVLRKRQPGLMHALIFWGFLLITVGTLELFVVTLNKGWNFEFIGSSAYSFLAGAQDTFAALVLLSILFALYRRVVLKPPGLGSSKDAYVVIAFTSTLMLSLFAMNAFRMVADPKWYDGSMWISYRLSLPLAAAAFPLEWMQWGADVFRWVHLLLVLGFLTYIPRSKHLHVLAAGPNTVLRHLDVAKPMRPLDLENENATQFGVKTVADLSWKDALDGYACTECGRCQDACPAWNTSKPLSPKKLILWMKDHLYENQEALLSGKREDVKPLIDAQRITEDFIWACTSCRACEINCPVFIEHTDKIYEVRRSLVLMDSQFPAELNGVFRNIETNFSPWAMSPEERGAWTQELDFKVPTLASLLEAGQPMPDYLFWVGCAGSFDDRNKKVSKALVSLMRKAGLSYAILGQEEKCTGDPARRAGNEYLAQMLIKENVETLNRYGVKKIVTACPHCFNALAQEWKAFGGHYDVIHHSQLLSELVAKGALTPKSPTKETVTYHDSCYLGRWNGEYQAPRKLLESVVAGSLKEMDKNQENAMCCGAGGGRMWMEETIGKRINVERTEQALATGATTVAANCPFCITMITDGLKTKERSDQVQVKDIAEILQNAVEG